MNNFEIENNINKLGFCKFNFTGLEQISLLKRLYNDYLSEDDIDGMVVSLRGSNERNKAINEGAYQILSSDIEKYFPNFDFFLAHYIVKEAGTTTSFQMHQDWNIVNEQKHKSYQIWLPMYFSYPENSGMFFVPRSQDFNQCPRSGSFGMPRLYITPQIYPYLSYTRLLPGQGVVFPNKSLHGSFSNATPENRIALLIDLVEKKAPNVYYHYNREKKQTEIYPITPTFLLDNLRAFEKGLNPFTIEPKEVIPTAEEPRVEYTSEEDVIQWIKADRKSLGVEEDYEFKQHDLFLDPSIERKVNHYGYTVLPLLKEKELLLLREGIKNLNGNVLENSSEKQSLSNKYEANHQYINQIIGNCLNFFFKEYKCPISIFYQGRKDGVQQLDWHTTSSVLLNQHLEPLYEIWCPLKDVTLDNSVVHLVPGSHRLINSLIHTHREWPLKLHNDLFDKYGKGVALKAGEALLFDARIVHAVAPLIDPTDCIVLRLTHKEAEFFSMLPKNKITVADIQTEGDSYLFDIMTNKPKPLQENEVENLYYFLEEKISRERVLAQLDKFSEPALTLGQTDTYGKV